jgi:hypothetical protein
MFTFIETKLFTKLFDETFGEDDDALSELQEFLRRDPEAGDIVKDSGVYARCAGAYLAGANVGACASSTTSGRSKDRSGS